MRPLLSLQPMLPVYGSSASEMLHSQRAEAVIKIVKSTSYTVVLRDDRIALAGYVAALVASCGHFCRFDQCCQCTNFNRMKCVIHGGGKSDHGNDVFGHTLRDNQN